MFIYETDIFILLASASSDWGDKFLTLSTVRHLFSFLCVEKGAAADATDAPQPWGLLWNPVMKMIN
jgi:hypothetical protein